MLSRPKNPQNLNDKKRERLAALRSKQIVAAYRKIGEELEKKYDLTLGRSRRPKARAYRPQDLLPVREASSVTGLAVKTLANKRTTGDGPRYVQLGRRVFYRYGDLMAYIEANLRLSTSENGGADYGQA